MKKIEAHYCWMYGLSPFRIFSFSKNKMRYEDVNETNYLFLITWLKVRISFIYPKNFYCKNKTFVKHYYGQYCWSQCKECSCIK